MIALHSLITHKRQKFTSISFIQSSFYTWRGYEETMKPGVYCFMPQDWGLHDNRFKDSGKKIDTMANVSNLAGNPMCVVMDNTIISIGNEVQSWSKVSHI